MAQSHDEPPSPPPLPVEHNHANRDPLTNEPGAHPVGVGMGAASAGAVGALLGAVAGPVGVLVGSVVGAFAGGLVGKETAESVNPTEPAALAPPGPPPVVDPAAETVVDEQMAAPGSLVAPVVFPEPMAEPPPLPHGGTRLHQTVLAGRPAPPPLEITAQTAYPEDNVRDAAYFRYLERQRNGQPGDELDDWATAEREVLRD